MKISGTASRYPAPDITPDFLSKASFLRISLIKPYQAYLQKRLSFTKIVEPMNQRGSTRSQQRAARGKRTRRDVEEGEADAPGSGGTGSAIEVAQPPARRRRTEASASDSSPSTAPAARTAARRGGKGSTGRRVTRSTRGRGVA